MSRSWRVVMPSEKKDYHTFSVYIYIAGYKLDLVGQQQVVYPEPFKAYFESLQVGNLEKSI